MKIRKRLSENILGTDQTLLEELTFGESSESVLNHYRKHVLQPGEEFDPTDPKFEPMTKAQYLQNCDDLIKKKCSTDFNSDVFGWLQWRPGDRDYTIVKFEKMKSGQYQRVAYEAFGTNFLSAYTYVLYRGGLPRIKKSYDRQKKDGEWISDMNDQAYFTFDELDKFDEQK